MYNKVWTDPELHQIRILVNLLRNDHIATHLNTVFWNGEKIRSSNGVRYIYTEMNMNVTLRGYITPEQCCELLSLKPEELQPHLDRLDDFTPYRNRFKAPEVNGLINANQYAAISRLYPALPINYITDHTAAKELRWSLEDVRKKCQTDFPHILRNGLYAIDKELIRKTRMYLLQARKDTHWKDFLNDCTA